MAELTVSTPDVKRVVDDWDFTFIGGILMPITVDVKAGDVITFGAESIMIDLCSKPSKVSPSKMLPQESIIIYRHQLLAVQHRNREVLDLTPEQQFEWSKTMEKLSSSVN